MTAAGKRDEMSDVIAAQLNGIREAAIIETSSYIGTKLSVPHLVEHLHVPGSRMALLAIRAAAEAYAQAKVDEAVGAMRLQLAAAEYAGRPA